MIRNYIADLVTSSLPSVYSKFVKEAAYEARATLRAAPFYVRIPEALLVFLFVLWVLPVGVPSSAGSRWRDSWARIYFKLPGPFSNLERIHKSLIFLHLFEKAATELPQIFPSSSRKHHESSLRLAPGNTPS